MSTADLLLGRRTRQNHALEHATVTLLARRIPGLNVSARSSARGFIIFADLDLGVTRDTCEEALARLQAGEAQLAIHPNCGTNLAVAISLTAVGSVFALTSLRPRARWAAAVATSAAGFASARPLGGLLQRYVTTLPDLHDVRISAVRSRRLLGRQITEVLTTIERADLADLAGLIG